MNVCLGVGTAEKRCLELTRREVKACIEHGMEEPGIALGIGVLWRWCSR
jgi:hypothetical protein